MTAVLKVAPASLELTRSFERRLAAEGLAPLDSAGDMVSHRDSYAVRDADGAASARDAWMTWAQAVLDDPSCFKGKRSERSDARVHLRAVWELYAEGKSIGEISAALDVGREAVKKAIRRVKFRAPAPPVLNPWRKSGRDEALCERASPRALARICRLAIEAAGLDAVLEVIGNDKKLLRLLPQKGDTMAEKETKGESHTWKTYSLIMLAEPLAIPGVAVRKAELHDVEARAHAGGIDVRLPLAPTENAPEMIVTLPWHRIKLAKRPAS